MSLTNINIFVIFVFFMGTFDEVVSQGVGSNGAAGPCPTGTGGCASGQACVSGTCYILPANCIDGNVNCPTLAANGLCTSTIYNAAAKLNCRLSCGFCSTSTIPSTCVDSNTNCTNFARNGFCISSFYSSIRSTCAKSCGLCTGK